MGGGDLNMKKSWHPLLMKNQERVWLKEKDALAEKKKLEQLRKEKEEERQLQELQRLQEEQTGKKRQEKLDWMYASPATGGGPSANELEEYLLGKKRVDKILVGDENEKVGASHKNFIAVQNANNARDTAAKIREDPLFAIKQQEQQALKDLMSNPLRLKMLKERAGIRDAESKKEKKKSKDKGKRKYRDDDYAEDERRSRHSHDRPHHRRSSSRSRTRSPSPQRRRRDDRRSRSSSPRREGRYSDIPRRDYHTQERREHLRSPRHSPSRTPPRPRESMDRREDYRSTGRARTPPRYERNERPRDYERRRTPPRRDTDRSDYRKGYAPSTSSSSDAAAERAARLAAMTQDASNLESSRQVRLAAMEANEKAELAIEEALRKKTGSSGQSSFMRQQEKILYGNMRLDERIQRGRAGLVREAD
ncbi:RNA-splicing factor [Tulasnella sp. 403]|nr:RNA-splicing factor [Tulasnella sp. 403]